MEKLLGLLILVVYNCLQTSARPQSRQPEQVHLSLGVKPSQMVVTWLTQDDVNATVMVEYGTQLGQYQYQALGQTTVFVDGGAGQTVRYIHRAKMVVAPGQRYFYHVGSNAGWSNMFYFNTLPAGTNISYKVCIFGDLGIVNGVSFGRLQRDAQRGAFDLVIHVGDFAYDLSAENGTWGDQFMRQIEPIAAYVPYMVVAGNHEETYNYSNYVNLFTMPNSSDNQYYSFDMGPVHFVALSTEYYGFFYKYGLTPVFNQFKWLNDDLAKANQNRDNVPWILTYMHRPLYCSNENSEECMGLDNDLIRNGVPGVPGLEDTFNTHAIDFGFWGHEHSYERMWPVYNRNVYNQSADPYHNAPAPIYVVTGSAGCYSLHAGFDQDPAPWSAVRALDYGYSILTVYNYTHLYLQQISDDKNGAVIDSLWITKDRNHYYNAVYRNSLRSVHIPKPKRSENHVFMDDSNEIH
uniref:Purple acid phosphatase n=1 Tax=Plectus sambesii TaxID=2011161 RepID=A0A914WR41_9BILA